jgi:hypothetical protein
MKSARIAPSAPTPTIFFAASGSVKRMRFAMTVPTTDPVATRATSGPSTTPPKSDARIARITPTYSRGVNGLMAIPPRGAWPASPTCVRMTKTRTAARTSTPMTYQAGVVPHASGMVSHTKAMPALTMRRAA